MAAALISVAFVFLLALRVGARRFARMDYDLIRFHRVEPSAYSWSRENLLADRPYHQLILVGLYVTGPEAFLTEGFEDEFARYRRESV